jgi:hypothetical protein
VSVGVVGLLTVSVFGFAVGVVGFDLGTPIGGGIASSDVCVFKVVFDIVIA